MRLETLKAPARWARRLVIRDAVMAGCAVAAIGFASHALHAGLSRVMAVELASLLLALLYAAAGAAVFLSGRSDGGEPARDRAASRSNEDAALLGDLASAFMAGYRAGGPDEGKGGR